VTTALAKHIAEAEQRGLAPDVADRAKQHMLDSLIAVLSGATLRPGLLAISYVRSRGCAGDSTVAGGPRTSAELAAFANAMCAHADETDDVNPRARLHPGASVVPAAVAVAEALDRPGSALLTAVSLGYDLACAVNIGAWKSLKAMERSARTTHGAGQTFGTAAAAASLAELTLDMNRYVLSYAAQQVSGISTFYRDPEHVGKAFASAAMQAHAGVWAAELVRLGFSANDDVFDGSPNAFDAIGENGDSDRMLRDLETNHHVMTTDMKQYPVGGPIQAAAEAVERLMQTEGLHVDDVELIEAHLPSNGAYIVDNRAMPDINLQYILSVLLLDGQITFKNSHDYERRHSPLVRAMMDRIRLIADPTLDVFNEVDLASRRTWRATVTVMTRSGRTLLQQVDPCRGAYDNPMSWDQLAGKAHMTLGGVMLKSQVDELIQWTQSVETAPTVRDLRPLIEAPTTLRT
jgi:2-methylcitrate dehydratase PrpD